MNVRTENQGNEVTKAENYNDNQVNLSLYISKSFNWKGTERKAEMIRLVQDSSLFSL